MGLGAGGRVLSFVCVPFKKFLFSVCVSVCSYYLSHLVGPVRVFCIRVHMPVCLECAHAVYSAVEARRGCWIPWSWSFR